MPGIKQWSKNVEVAANPARRMAFIDLSSTVPLAAGATYTVDLYSSPGYIARILAMRINWPAVPAATSGTKYFSAVCTGENGTKAVSLLYEEQAFNKLASFDMGAWQAAPANYTTYAPQTEIASLQMMQQYYDNFNQVRFSFQNITNVADAGIEKRLLLWVMEEKLGG